MVSSRETTSPLVLTAFDADTIGNTLAATAKAGGVKTGVLVHPTRLACTGQPVGPSLYHLHLLNELCRGYLLADLFVIYASLDIMIGEADR
jgi:NADH:ubiquinone oxidoreductase subunit D